MKKFETYTECDTSNNYVPRTKLENDTYGNSYEFPSRLTTIEFMSPQNHSGRFRCLFSSSSDDTAGTAAGNTLATTMGSLPA